MLGIINFYLDWKSLFSLKKMFFLVVYQTFFCWLEKNFVWNFFIWKINFWGKCTKYFVWKTLVLGSVWETYFVSFCFLFFFCGGTGWKNFLDNYVLGVFIDLSNAFDTIDLWILLKKLEMYSANSKNLTCFSKYLNVRKQYIKIAKFADTVKQDIKLGVSQKSILGPSLS